LRIKWELHEDTVKIVDELLMKYKEKVDELPVLNHMEEFKNKLQERE
jgi:hypothetical protein